MGPVSRGSGQLSGVILMRLKTQTYKWIRRNADGAPWHRHGMIYGAKGLGVGVQTGGCKFFSLTLCLPLTWCCLPVLPEASSCTETFSYFSFVLLLQLGIYNYYNSQGVTFALSINLYQSTVDEIYCDFFYTPLLHVKPSHIKHTFFFSEFKVYVLYLSDRKIQICYSFSVEVCLRFQPADIDRMSISLPLWQCTSTLVTCRQPPLWSCVTCFQLGVRKTCLGVSANVQEFSYDISGVTWGTCFVFLAWLEPLQPSSSFFPWKKNVITFM